MEWLPNVSVEVEKVAVPPPDSVPVPSVVAPSLKVTVPVGVTPAPATVAVKVIACPSRLGLADDATVVADEP